MPTRPPTHRPAQLPRHDTAPREDHRESAAARGYDATWRRLRLMKLARNPLCEPCERAGLLTVAIEVHHVKPLSEGGERLSLANLESLCRACHERTKRGRKHGT